MQSTSLKVSEKPSVRPPLIGTLHLQNLAQALRSLVFAGWHGLGDDPSYSLFNMGGSKFGNITSLLLGSPGFGCGYSQPPRKQDGLQDRGPKDSCIIGEFATKSNNVQPFILGVP